MSRRPTERLRTLHSHGRWEGEGGGGNGMCITVSFRGNGMYVHYYLSPLSQSLGRDGDRRQALPSAAVASRQETEPRLIRDCRGEQRRSSHKLIIHIAKCPVG